MKQSFVDKFISFFSPKAGLARMQAKINLNVVKNSYEAADRNNFSRAWRASNRSARDEVAQDLEMLRNRSRDMVRNNPYARTAMNLRSTNIIGTGIHAQLKFKEGVSEKRKDIFRKEWESWSENPKKIDYEGTKSLVDIQELVAKTIFQAGEVLIRKRIKYNRPHQLQILEPDFLIPRDYYLPQKISGKNRIVDGVEFSKSGKRVAYHFFKVHPGSLYLLDYLNLAREEISRVSARNVIHLFEEERPGQIRGVPPLATAMNQLKNIEDCSFAELLKQKIASCFVGFQKQVDPVDDIYRETNTKNNNAEKLTPGTMEVLPPGKDIVFSDPPKSEGFQKFLNPVLKSVAGSLGLSYESLSGDLSDVNFSSARMGFLTMDRLLNSYREKILVRRFMYSVWDWFVESLIFRGFSVDVLERPSFLSKKREMIDPTKETQAEILSLRSGLKSLSQSLIERGISPEKHIKEISEINKMLDKYNVVLDSDSRNTNRAGTEQGETKNE